MITLRAAALVAIAASGSCGNRESASELGSSAEARAILSELRARPTSPFGAGLAARFQLVPGGLSPQFSTAAERGSARVLLPALSTAPLHLEDLATGVSVDVKLKDAREVPAQAADGYLVYPRAHASGATVLHRPLPTGAEDFLSFETRPPAPEVSYALALGQAVRGLRLVAGTLEVLGTDGAPRLRMSPPYIVGADGGRTDAALAVEGCAVDMSPAAPWDRPVTTPGASTCTLRVSWPGEAVAYPAVLDPRWTTTGTMTTPRQEHTATLLSTGKVLVAGGRVDGGTAALASAELYDRTTGSWAATTSMVGARRLATATQLGTTGSSTTSGKILIAGGINGTASLNTAQLYSVTAGTWIAATNLNAPRYAHTATLLSDGRVLFAGGLNGTATLATAALYNPASGAGSWTATTGPIPPPGLKSHTATLLVTGNAQLNNKVLLVGGNSGTATLSAVYLFDPAQSAFSTLASLPSAREGHTATVLPNGKLLVTGGRNGATTLATAVAFDPSSGPGSWSSAGTMTAARSGHTATLLQSGIVENGQVLIAGGSSGTASLGSAELFTGTNSWTATTAMPAAVQGHTATMLGNGQVLIAGGVSGTAVTGAARLYDASFALACTTGSQCTAGFCVNGVCCDTACDSGCGACNLPNKVGTCSPVGNTVVCRASAGACDPAETCSGTSLTCPGNTFAPATMTCRASAGACDVAETCTGSSAACPVDQLAPPTVVCRPSAGVCDAAESCTGASPSCPTDRFSTGTPCRPAAGPCDVAETCTGQFAGCPTDVLLPANAVCRPSAGACDLQESCTGVAADCPADGKVADETPCDAANATASCTGGTCLVSSCDANFDHCGATPDNACETPIDTVTACGQCGNECAFGTQHPFCAGNRCACTSSSCATCNEQHPEVVADVITVPQAPGLPGGRQIRLTGFARAPNARIDIQILRHLAFPDGNPLQDPADNPASCVADWYTIPVVAVSAQTPSFGQLLYKWTANIIVDTNVWPEGGIGQFRLQANGGSVETAAFEALPFQLPAGDLACVQSNTQALFENLMRDCAGASRRQLCGGAARQILTLVDPSPAPTGPTPTDPPLTVQPAAFCKAQLGHFIFGVSTNEEPNFTGPSGLPARPGGTPALGCDDPDLALNGFDPRDPYIVETGLYYDRIDKTQARLTLDAWKQVNNFPPPNQLSPVEVSARYYNAGDLGVGRDMHCWPSQPQTNPSARACYVSNYGASFVGFTLDDAFFTLLGTPQFPGPLPSGLAATVAMEYMPGEPDPVRFFVFDETGTRQPKVKLDTENPKPVPGNCLTCHGGKYDPGTHSVTQANFLPFDPCAFTFSTKHPYTLADQEEKFRRLNQIVRDTGPDQRDGAGVRELIDGMYDGQVGAANRTIDESYVPPAWQGTGLGLTADQNQELSRLYLDVVKPYCRSCHTSRSVFPDQPNPPPPGLPPPAFPSFTLLANSWGFVCSPNLHFMPHAEATMRRFWKSSARAELINALNDGTLATAAAASGGNPMSAPGTIGGCDP